MRTSELPLHVRQRIESKWSAQAKRMEQQRDRKLPQHAADGGEARAEVGSHHADEARTSKTGDGT
jgi:hypothetical protein